MTKEKLRSYISMKAEIKQLEEQLAEMEARAHKMTTQITADPRGGNDISDKMAEIVCAIVDMQSCINDRVKDLYCECVNIEQAISGLSTTERRIIRSRYIQGKSWESICVEIGYAWAQTHRIHAEVLKMLAGKR